MPKCTLPDLNGTYRFGGLSISAAVEQVSYPSSDGRTSSPMTIFSSSSAGFTASIATAGFALGLLIIEARLFALTPLSPAAPRRHSRAVFKIQTEHLAVCKILCGRRHEVCRRNQHGLAASVCVRRQCLSRDAPAQRRLVAVARTLTPTDLD